MPATDRPCRDLAATAATGVLGNATRNGPFRLPVRALAVLDCPAGLTEGTYVDRGDEGARSMGRRTTVAGVVAAAVLIITSAAGGGGAPDTEGWRKSQKQFMAWQRRMLQRRARPTEQMRRIFYRKTTVPPPMPATNSGRGGIWDKIKYHTRFDYSIFDPLGLAPGMPDVGVGMGDPKVNVSLKAHAKVLRFVAANHDLCLLAIGPDSKTAFGDTTTALKAGLLGAPLPRTNVEAEAAWTLLMTAAGLRSGGGAAKLAGSYGVVSGSVGLTSAGEVQMAVGVGRKLVPDQYAKVAQAELQVEAELTVPVVVEDVQWRSKHGVSQVASNAAAKITRMLSHRMPCPYCKQSGEATCQRCWNRRTLTCPKCSGRRKVKCSHCRNGRISCPTTEPCPRCSGRGRLRCAACSGTGRIEVRKQYTRQETRSYRVPYQAGFDRNGDPIVRYRTEYKTVNVPYWVTESNLCSSCNGIGWAGPCGFCRGTGRVTCRRCGGRGWYTCPSCGGTAEVTCPSCKGTGRIVCPTCGGRKIPCPLCKGKKRIGVGT
jgi:hypothetical protein